jgi:hypothetical protein
LGLALGGPGGVQTDLKLEVGGKPEKSCQVIFPSGFALVGNLGRGSDHVSNMEARQRTIELLLSYPKVKFVIVNSLRASVKWDVDLITSLKAKILYVHLDISPQENLRRISARRDKNETGEMSEKTLNNVISFHERAAMVARAAENSGGKILKLVDKDSVVNSVKKLKAAL